MLSREIAGDEAINAADPLLLTIPNQSGGDYDAILKCAAPDSAGAECELCEATPGSATVQVVRESR